MRPTVEATTHYHQGDAALQGLMRPVVEATSNHQEESAALQGLIRPTVGVTSNHNEGSAALQGLLILAAGGSDENISNNGPTPAQVAGKDEALLSSFTDGMLSDEEKRALSQLAAETRVVFYPSKNF